MVHLHPNSALHTPRWSCCPPAHPPSQAERLYELAQKQDEQARWNSLASALAKDQQARAAAMSPVVSSANLLGVPPHAAPPGGQHDDLSAELECSVCWAAPKSMVCIPCGHVCLCPACAHDIQAKKNQCPMCRAKIEETVLVSC